MNGRTSPTDPTYNNGVTLADLPALREIAAALPVTELDHPMTTAARLLLWERGRKATR